MNINNLVNKISALKKIFIILLIALGLRWINLDGSFWLDESAQALESARPFSQQLDIIPDFQPPLLHFITHFAIQFSHSEWWLRMWGAVIPGLISIFLTYQISRKLFTEKIALFSSTLLTTSSFHIFFSQELRPYSLSVVFALLSTYFLIDFFIQKPKKGKNSSNNISMIGFIFSSILGLYSSYVYIFFVIGQFLLMLIAKVNFKQILFSTLMIILAYLPWLPMFFKQLQAGQLLRTQMPGWENVVSYNQLKSIPLTFGKFLYGNIPLDINIPYMAITLLIIALISSITFYYIKLSERKNLQNFYHLLFLFSSTIILGWLVSFFVPVIQPKRLIFLLPFFYIILSALIFNFKNSWSKISAYSLAIILLGINFFSTHQIMTIPDYQREDWRSLHQEIKTRFPSNETIVVNSYTAPFSPWAWYDRNSEFATLSTGYYYIDNVPDLIQTLKPITDYDYVLVFDYLRDLTDPNDKLIQEIEAFGYKGIGVIDRPNIGFVRIYTKNNTNLSQAKRCLKLL